MAGGNWSKLVTVNTGDLITASERNNEFNNVIANSNQDGIAGASEDLGHMQAQTDPNPGGTPSLATSGRSELTAIRFLLSKITGQPFWYTSPTIALSQLAATYLALAGGTMTGPIAMGTNKITGMGDGTSLTDAVTLQQLSLRQIVYATTTTATATASAVFTATSLSMSVTLKRAAGNLLLIAIGHMSCNPNSAFYTIEKDSATNLGDATNGLGVIGNGNTGSVTVPVAMAINHAPGDTSAHTYAVYIRTSSSGCQWGTTAPTVIVGIEY